MKVFVGINKSPNPKSVNLRIFVLFFKPKTGDVIYLCNGTIEGKRVSVSSGPRKEECLLFPSV